MSVQTDDFLAHYGVKGMKWGVRRANLRESRDAVARAKQDKEDAKARLKAAKAVKRADQKEMAKSVLGTAATITAGVVIAAAVIKASRNKKARAFIKENGPKVNEGRKGAKLVLDRHGGKMAKRYLTPYIVNPVNIPNAIDAKSKDRKK